MPATRTRCRWGALAAAACALPLGLAGCSGSSTVAASTTTTRAGANSACALVMPSEIKTTLGKEVGDPVAKNAKGATACSYPSTNSSDKADSVIINFRGGVTSADAGTEQAELQRLHGTTTSVNVTGPTSVSGSAASAYYYTVKSGGQSVISLVTLVDETQVTITSTASVARSEALSKQIFATFAADATTTTKAG